MIVIEVNEAKILTSEESLLNEYKSRNDSLMKDLNVLGQGSYFRCECTWEVSNLTLKYLFSKTIFQLTLSTALLVMKLMNLETLL